MLACIATPSSVRGGSASRAASTNCSWWRARQWARDHFAYNFDCERGMVSTRIFAGGRTNIAFNCLDRHVEAGRGSQPCFLWEARAWMAIWHHSLSGLQCFNPG